MKTVSFINQGLIDLRAVRTFGVSAKENDHPIGFFGTGLKYAIAICLRLGHTITLYRGHEKFEFATSGAAIRNTEFRIVTMNGEELGFTTDLGKTWVAWQAFRELYCNALDEDGQVLAGDCEPADDHTLVVVTGDAFHRAFEERDLIVLPAGPRWVTGKLEVRDNPNNFAYYRGVRALQLQQSSMLTYSVLSDLEITEDRTVKNGYQLHNAVAREIVKSEDRELLERVLTADSDSFEGRLDLDIWQTPSEIFLRTLEEITFRRCGNSTALRLYKKHRKRVLEPDRTPLNRIEEIQLRRALDFCEGMNYPIQDYPIVVTADLEDLVWGRAYEGCIYINRSAFQAGTKIVAGTLIEEYLHLKHDLRDESRELQNHLLNALVSQGELARGEPL